MPYHATELIAIRKINKDKKLMHIHKFYKAGVTAVFH